MVKKEIEHNNKLVEEENKKIQPLKDKKIENISKIQKINLRNYKLRARGKKIKELNNKLLIILRQ